MGIESVFVGKTQLWQGLPLLLRIDDTADGALQTAVTVELSPVEGDGNQPRKEPVSLESELRQPISIATDQIAPGPYNLLIFNDSTVSKRYTYPEQIHVFEPAEYSWQGEVMADEQFEAVPTVETSQNLKRLVESVGEERLSGMTGDDWQARLDVSWAPGAVLSANRVQWVSEGLFDIVRYLGAFRLRELLVRQTVTETGNVTVDAECFFGHHIDQALARILEQGYLDLRLLNARGDLSPFDYSIQPHGYDVRFRLRYNANAYVLQTGAGD